jgi:hypothetical protein
VLRRMQGPSQQPANGACVLQRQRLEGKGVVTDRVASAFPRFAWIESSWYANRLASFIHPSNNAPIPPPPPFFCGGPQFVINIYYDDAEGEQVCTCCFRCEGWRYVPGAQIYAQCSAGDGSTSLVRFKSWVSHQKIGVAPGKVVHYKAAVKNIDKRAALSGLALTVQLPEVGVAYSSSKSSRAYRISSSGHGKVSYRKVRGRTAVVDTTSMPPTVTWPDLELPPSKGIRFTIKVRVDTQGVYRGMPLVFRGAAYQQLPVNGQPYCSTAYVNQTVLVRKHAKKSKVPI